eukprot:1549323-Prymnesium_polylepis.1
MKTNDLEMSYLLRLHHRLPPHWKVKGIETGCHRRRQQPHQSERASSSLEATAEMWHLRTVRPAMDWGAAETATP